MGPSGSFVYPAEGQSRGPRADAARELKSGRKSGAKSGSRGGSRDESRRATPLHHASGTRWERRGEPTRHAPVDARGGELSRRRPVSRAKATEPRVPQPSVRTVRFKAQLRAHEEVRKEQAIERYTKRVKAQADDFSTPRVVPNLEKSSAANRGVTMVTVGPDGDGQRLDQWLVKRFKDIPKSKLYRIIRTGEVRVNKSRAKGDTRLALSDVIRLPPMRVEPEGSVVIKRVPDRLTQLVENALVYQDDDVLVIAKPSGLAVHGGSGLDFGVIEALRASRPHETLELAHRLDRDTSGLLLVARHRKALVALHALLREGKVEKRYLTLVKGAWNLGDKQIDAPLETEARVAGLRKVRVGERGKAAISHFRPVDFFGNIATLMEVNIDTGRTHQIRVHAAHVGHPVAGDDRYGDPEFNQSLQAIGLERLFLHAQSLSFEWPNGKSFAASQPLPEDLKAALDQLAKMRSHRAKEKAISRGTFKRSASRAPR